MTRVLTTRTRMDAVQAPIVPVIGAMIRDVPGTISLGQGVVHSGPPQAAIDAVSGALASPSTHEYQDGAGLPALVDRLALKLREENGIDVARGVRIMVTAGANMAFMHAVLAITAPGDEIILNVPFYFNHEMAIQMADCTAVRVATDDRYQPRLDALRAAITDRTRAIVTVTPNNPSGAVFGEEALGDINALCRDRGIYHIADEVYEVSSPTDRRGTYRPEPSPAPRAIPSRCTRSRRPTASPGGASATCPTRSISRRR